MTRYILFTLICSLLLSGLWAQQPQNDMRTNQTKIADLLMQLPAQNSADFNLIMGELSQMSGQIIATVAPSLVAPGNGEDTQLRYAVSGLVKYIADGGNPATMRECSQALCNAIASVNDDEVKDFLLQELQFIAGDEAVPLMASLLRHSRLADPAARVLINISSESAAKALMRALPRAREANKVIIAQALGTMQYAPAARSLKRMARSSKIEEKKAAMRALAQIGHSPSKPLLEKAAMSADFAYEASEATASYLLLLEKMAVGEHKTAVVNELEEIMFNENIPVQTRSKALRIFTNTSDQAPLPQLLQALQSPGNEFRMAALYLLDEQFSEGAANELMKLAKSTSNMDLRSEIIWLLSANNYHDAIPFITESIHSDNRQVQLAAVHAAGSLRHKESVPGILKVMNTADAEIIHAARQSLLIIGGDEIADAVAEVLPRSDGPARIAFIDIIAEKQADRYSAMIFADLQNIDIQIAQAAFTALSAVVKPGDEEKIADLLNKVNTNDQITALQDALFKVISVKESTSQQVEIVTGFMTKPGAVEANYYRVLARIGGEESLPLIENVLRSGSEEQKEAAIGALTVWNDPAAMPILWDIAKSNSERHLRERALSGYIGGINRSGEPEDQKVLMFRNAMELATTLQQKRMILNQTAANKTLLALVFISKYIDNPNLQQVAVQSVRNIVLENKELYGPAVNEIVYKAIAVNQDAEADYQREALLKHLSELPEEGGFVSMFNGIDLTGWKGLVQNPIARAKMTPEELAAQQEKADERMRKNWHVEDGILIYKGDGYDNLCTEKMYGDFELHLDWKLEPEGDSGLYLRGTPQVQAWDTSLIQVGAQVGSGGLYNNQKHPSVPLLVADNPIDEWNTFRIIMVDDKVTVYLNGLLVTDNVVLENFWDRGIPVFGKEAIELQAHTTRVEFRDMYIREIPRPEPYVLSLEEQDEGFVPLFNGIDLTGWTGKMVDYFAQQGVIIYQYSSVHGYENLYTEKEYSDFIFRFEFKLTPGANNGLGIRTPMVGDPAYAGMELQILDDDADIYRNLSAYQYHGSVYGVIPARRGFLKPVGEWNYQEVKAIGTRITITLNGEVIVDGDIAEASNNGTQTIDNLPHPGLLNPSGHIGFLGHGSKVKFRNIRIKDIGSQKP